MLLFINHFFVFNFSFLIGISPTWITLSSIILLFVSLASWRTPSFANGFVVLCTTLPKWALTDCLRFAYGLKLDTKTKSTPHKNMNHKHCDGAIYKKNMCLNTKPPSPARSNKHTKQQHTHSKTDNTNNQTNYKTTTVKHVCFTTSTTNKQQQKQTVQ